MLQHKKKNIKTILDLQLSNLKICSHKYKSLLNKTKKINVIGFEKMYTLIYFNLDSP
jgi:hypothetical protein